MAEKHVSTNLTLKQIKQIHAGDELLFTGTFITARDRAHRWLVAHDFKPMQHAVVYHCGPMYEETKAGIKILAAGPTTSARFNHYTPALIEKYGIRAIIGKGGMDEGVRQSLYGKAIYCAAIGGAAVLYAHCITKVKHVYKTEFGMTDAIWELEVKDFPVICMMDARGNSLFQEVENQSKVNAQNL